MALVTASNFRIFSFVEAASFLILLLIAMPLKYAFALPLAVSVVGAAHGLIFMLYLVFVAIAAPRLGWSLPAVLGALVAAVLPFGPFVFDRMVLSKGVGHGGRTEASAEEVEQG